MWINRSACFFHLAIRFHDAATRWYSFVFVRQYPLGRGSRADNLLAFRASAMFIGDFNAFRGQCIDLLLISTLPFKRIRAHIRTCSMNYSNTRLAYSNLVLGYLSDYHVPLYFSYFPFPSHNFLPLLYEKHEIFILVINNVRPCI